MLWIVKNGRMWVGACKFIYRYAWYNSKQESVRAACVHVLRYVYYFIIFSFSFCSLFLETTQLIQFSLWKLVTAAQWHRHHASEWNLYIIFLRFCLLLICWFVAEECVSYYATWKCRCFAAFAVWECEFHIKWIIHVLHSYFLVWFRVKKVYLAPERRIRI